MLNSLCRFMPPKKTDQGLSTTCYVYECDILKFQRPLISGTFRVNCVANGSCNLKYGGKTYKLTRGSLFFIFPHTEFDFTDENDFKFIYISFLGEYGKNLLSDYGISHNRFIFPPSEYLINIFEKNIKIITKANANLITESTLLQALAYAADHPNGTNVKDDDSALSVSLKNYIDMNFCNEDISLEKLSFTFRYTTKYISFKFKQSQGIGISEYITELRINRATKFIESGITSISQISSNCGFRDPLYFSKVFKKYKGMSPSDYIKNLSIDPISQLLSKYVYNNEDLQ